MPATCFTCGETGHVAAGCPNQESLDTRPRWCGFCDPRTRLVAVNRDQTELVRCQNCHPAPRKPLPQHKRCEGCRAVIYVWDTAPCGKHAVPGEHRPHRDDAPGDPQSAAPGGADRASGTA